MRKILSLLICFIVVFSLVSCKESHVHNESADYIYSEEAHWKTCDSCDELIEYSSHTFDDNVCTVCGYVREHECDGVKEYHADDEGHYYICDSCQQEYSRESHDYVDNICTICGYEKKIILLRKDGELLSQYNDVVKDYLKTEDESDLVYLLSTFAGASYDKQEIKLKWQMVSGASLYVITLGTKEDLSDGKDYESVIPNYTPNALYPGTKYYYKVTAYDKNEEKMLDSAIDSFETEDYGLRQVNIYGLYNVRDLGGWKTEDGRTVSYDKIYRGGRLTGITEKGIDVMENELGIKSEIDLRYDGTKEVTFEAIDYYKYNIWSYTMIIPGYSTPAATDNESIHRTYDSASTANIKKIFTLLADENNYPVYFHCNAGADRTGTLAYLINGMLGVSYEDLAKDFELTSFSSQGLRARSKIVGEEFDDSGIYQNNTDNLIAFGKLNELMMSNYGTGDGKLSSAIENYLIKVCNVKRSEIDSIKSIMLN